MKTQSRSKSSTASLAVMVTLALLVAFTSIANQNVVSAQNGTAHSNAAVSTHSVDERTYKVRINNESDSQVLSPGVYVVHDRGVSLNFRGELSPSVYEPLAEVGNPEPLAEYLRGLDGVYQVIVGNSPIMPGNHIEFEVNGPRGARFSALRMPIGTNDALALVDSVRLSNRTRHFEARNYDNGTEENSPLLSGFDGGQPDPTRGAENIDNGIATDPQEAFQRHPQLTETVMSGYVERISDYKVKINNVSDSQILSPGVYVVHDRDVSLNFRGELSPSVYEPLAEVGNPEPLAEYLRGLDGVHQVIVGNNPIMPGSGIEFEVTGPHGARFSALRMPIGTNDALALVDSIRLGGRVGNTRHFDARNYDNGTEENSPLLSGFDGGQPDPTRGAENIDNGIATEPQEEFRRHRQLRDTVMSGYVERLN